MLLNCHSCYSFRYGTLPVEALMNEALLKGYSQLAITDINNTSACIDSVRQAKEKGLHVAMGIDFRNGIRQQYVGLAQNNAGFRELNEHLSAHLHSGENFHEQAPAFNNVYIIYPFAGYRGWPLRANEYVGVSIKDLGRLQFSPYKNMVKQMVVQQPVSFAGKKQFNAHRLLRAIDLNTLLSKLPVSEQADESETMPTLAELQNAFSAYPILLQNTQHLLVSCSIDFGFGKFANKNLRHYTGSEAGDHAKLRHECEAGLAYRFGSNPAPEVMQRLNKELDIICQMNFASYFLINHDIVNYARSKNYYYVGRGSGANSMAAYLLRITDVDPLELDLYFERFINPFRTNPPDFDIDFSWTDRDDMTRYIFDHFGHKRTALLGTYSTFQHDAVIRQLGKVFGLPATEIDKLQAREQPKDLDKLSQLVLQYSQVIQGLPSHVSIHASGIIISEEPVTSYSATFIPPKGYPTTQFSMLEAEDIGLYKFDILSQRGLGKIKDALSIIEQNKGVQIDIHDVKKFTRDETVKNLLREAKLIGCFYVESPGMRMLLSKLRADDYLRLVAASSIIRPGVSKSGMMNQYIARFRNQTLRDKARNEIPELYDLLQETYGVMVYQEDVIKIAHFFAGLSLAEADYLRRGMSWKFKQRNEFWVVKENFFKNCTAKGYAHKTISDIWNQIESFANFAFSKGHSASYAVESYQAMYLKAYFPLEYMVATLNNGGGFYRKELYVHEARMHGATIQMPCINTSDALTIIQGSQIYLGLGLVAELEQDTIQQVLANRQQQGHFSTLAEFTRRVPLPIEQLRLLIRAGAFRFTGINKKKLLWEAHMLVNPHQKVEKKQELFEVAYKKFDLPQLTNHWMDDAFDEIELIGFSLCSPFKLLRDEDTNPLRAADLSALVGKEVTITGYLVTVKHTSTSKGDRMCFGTFIDRDGQWIDTVHFPPSAKAYPFNGPGCYTITGRVAVEYDFLSIDVSRMKRLPVIDRETLVMEEIKI